MTIPRIKARTVDLGKGLTIRPASGAWLAPGVSSTTSGRGISRPATACISVRIRLQTFTWMSHAQRAGLIDKLHRSARTR